MKNEWYIDEYNEKPYLHNKELIPKKYSNKLPEHDHCELCWATFSENPNDLQAGYYERNSKSWICNDCYNSFKKLFGWKTGDCLSGQWDGSVVP